MRVRRIASRRSTSPPSDTNPKYTRACADAHPPVWVVREVHAEFVVDGSLVLGIGVGQHRDDVLELAHQYLNLGLRELVAGRFATDLPLEALALSLDLAIQLATTVMSPSCSSKAR